MNRRIRRKTTTQKIQETNTNLLHWVMPRLCERKAQFADYLTELLFNEKPEEIHSGRKGQSPDDFISFALAMPDDWFVKFYTTMLEFIERTQPDSVVKGGKKNA